MATILDKTVSRLRRIAGERALGEMNDRQLLERFSARGDEESFATLVRRHGGLVLGVCRRVLDGAQDAEDAFQATFLVLARKASSVAWQESVKNWLHGVAYRVALKARRQAARRRKHERKAAGDQPSAVAEAAETWNDLRRVLDEELSALPTRYRAPLILCYLEGRTRDEAAEELGWSAGSVKGRLERGREMLRQRLVRRGLPLAAVLCAGLVADASAATPSAALLQQTVASGLNFVGAGPAAAISSQITNLAHGALHAMLVAKLKLSAFALVLAALLGFGGHRVAQSAMAHDEAQYASIHIDAATDFPLDAQAGGKEDPKKARDGDRDREAAGRKDGITGAFVSFDPVKGLITLSLGREGARVEQSYHLAGKDVPFLSPTGEKLRPMSLRKEMPVLLTLNELGDVAEVRVQYPTASVTIKSVNVERGGISVQSDRGEKTFKVADGARLTLYGKAAQLADYKEGMRVELTLDADRSLILAISAVRRDGDGPPREGPRDGDRPKEKGPRDGDRPKEKGPRDGEKRPDGDRALYDLHGVITAINARENSVEILGGGEANPWIKAFQVAKDLKAEARMSRFSRELSLAELQKALRISAKLSEDKKSIVRMVVWMPAVRSTVRGVDAAKGTIDVGDETLVVDKETRILVNGKNATLADIMPGMILSGWLVPDRSRLIGVMAGRPDGEGRERE